MGIKDSVNQWAGRIKRDAVMLWFARRHPDTPLLAKALCVLAVAYALSPIDLIPDFIPVLGYLDDALLLPAVIWLAVRLLPPHVKAAGRRPINGWPNETPGRRVTWGRHSSSCSGSALPGCPGRGTGTGADGPGIPCTAIPKQNA